VRAREAGDVVAGVAVLSGEHAGIGVANAINLDARYRS
jgi:hypothetical protein